MSTEFCPECHQPMPSQEVVAGVRLTAFKARLFHYIRTHPGRSGIEIAEHFHRSGETKGDPAVSIRAHILQINDALMNTPVRIRGRQWSGYYVEKTRAAE
jgi:hypothetical protein